MKRPTIGKALFDEIVADPDNLALRHVYADWLEQQGEDERASLIRLQCGAEGLPKGPARSAMEKQAKALVRANPAWSAAVKKIKLGKKQIWRRGFLHGITLPAYRFVKVAEELFAAAPMLRAVIFPLPLDEIAALLSCPHVSRLTSADLSQFCHCNFCGIDTQIREVFVSPSFANLVSLRTAGNRIDEEGARVIAGSTSLPHLRELDLSRNELGNAGARVLLEAPWLGQLTRLDLRENGITPRAQAALRKRFGRVVRL
jgi:uncharacterized protein (TIGR02996 family)